MGKPPVHEPGSFIVLTAAPRHVFYHAQELFRKTHQLAEEIAGERQLPLEEVDADWRRATPRPVPEGREVAPADVLELVTDTDDRIKAALSLLNVNALLRDQPERDTTKQPADVLTELLTINRKLNRMMDRAFRMQDVYGQALRAVDYAGDLGAGYPPQADLEGSKQPLDVYRRLTDCLHLIRQVGVAFDVETLDWEDDGELQAEDVEAADVYDSATTVVAELSYLVRHVGAAHTAIPRGEYRRPRDVLPTHVFQLVGVLEMQLRMLATPAATEQAADGI